MLWYVLWVAVACCSGAVLCLQHARCQTTRRFLLLLTFCLSVHAGAGSGSVLLSIAIAQLLLQKAAQHVCKMLQELTRLLSLYYNKIYTYILTAPPGSLQLTGVLGLAALVIAYYQLKHNDDAPSSGSSQQRQGQQQSGRYGSRASPAAGAANGGSGRLAAGGTTTAAAAKAGAVDGSSSSSRQLELSGDPMSLERRVRSKLSGIRKVTISSLGPLTQEWSSTDLQEGATLRSEAVEVLRELCACTDAYIVTQVQDDVGQAVLMGSLEAAGLVGDQPGQLRPHRLLFCSTLDGKMAIVRQIEPDLHIDGSAKTIDDLKRFMPQLLHIQQPGTQAAGQGSSNVIVSSSLKAFFS